MRSTAIGLALALGFGAGQAAAADLGALDWLKGDWVGVGAGPDHGTGGFVFEGAAGGQVLMRRNFADYPAQDGKPAQHHRDLMVVYREGGALRATYWDNEGQTLHYAVTTADPAKVVMITDDPAGPRFRLTYRKTPDGLEGSFEIAPPPSRNVFAPYLSWTARKKPES